MPKKEIDYSKSLIYKIQHVTNQELLYVGSTTNFTKRKASHKERCNNDKEWNTKYNLKLYKMIRENGGWSQFKCIVVKEFPCKNRDELLLEEDIVMRELKTNMNKVRASITREEHLEYQRQKMRQYREVNFNGCNETNYMYGCIQHMCECGGSYTNKHKARHLKTSKHLNHNFT
jgi:hypothetical protein